MIEFGSLDILQIRAARAHPQGVALEQNLLGGDSFIAFLPPEDEKKIDNTPVEPGSVLIGSLPTDPGTVLQRTSDLIPDAKATLRQASQR